MIQGPRAPWPPPNGYGSQGLVAPPQWVWVPPKSLKIKELQQKSIKMNEIQ